MSDTIRIGLIGLDTSHVTAFTELLNYADAPHHIPGARVVAAFPGGNADFELSRSRVANFTAELRDKHGVSIFDSPEAVAEACDMVFIESVHGGAHLEEFRRTLRYRRPTFIDKPIALNIADALEIYRLAEEANVPVMSCSSLRFADEFVKLLQTYQGSVESCEVFGPMAEVTGVPGVFWYGVHSFEMIVAAMGLGCRQVQAIRDGAYDTFVLSYADGRQALVRGFRKGHQTFGALIHGPKSFEAVRAGAARPLYASLLEAIMGSLPKGRSAVPQDETFEVVRLMTAANKSVESMRPVKMEDIPG